MAFLLALANLLIGGVLDAASGPEMVRSWGSDPRELQFSCAVCLDGAEEAYAKTLVRGDADERRVAARVLWRGRSRGHASKVLDYLADFPPEGEEDRAFQQKVEVSLQPEAIASELREGNYRWGAWLAFLRPHKELIPVLLAGLSNREFLPETILALGNSRDLRALQPLLELLESEDYRTAGDAANALGYLGFPEAEPKLIAALASDNGWRQVNACGALAKWGTHRAVPRLKKLANDDSYTGALNVRGMAKRALESIKRREER